MFEFNDVKFRDVIDVPMLVIEKHKITSLTGQSGSGKTTILKMLNKMLSPTEGKILFNGQDMGCIDSVAHRRQVTMMSQTPVVFGGDIRDNLIAGLRFQKKEIPCDDVLTAMLSNVKLDKGLNNPAQTLSGGEKQRLALARIMLLDSEVYLLDEPASALDDMTAYAVVEMIAEHVKTENKTLVMVTHSKETAKRFSDEVIEVSSGRVKGGRA